jgi:hypothetical protein
LVDGHLVFDRLSRIYFRKADRNLSWSGYHLPHHCRDCPSKLKAESVQFTFPLPWRSAGVLDLKSLGDLEAGGHNEKLFVHSGVVGVGEPAGDQEVADADNENGVVKVSDGDQGAANADSEDGLVIVVLVIVVVSDN